VLARVQNMLEVRLLHRELRTFNDVLEQRVRERTAELTEALDVALELAGVKSPAAE
jgi:putative two-component system response regulator